MAESKRAKKEIESQIKENNLDEVVFNWAESIDENFFNTLECL